MISYSLLLHVMFSYFFAYLVFWLDAMHCEFHIFRYYVFLVLYKYSRALFWDFNYIKNISFSFLLLLVFVRWDQRSAHRRAHYSTLLSKIFACTLLNVPWIINDVFQYANWEQALFLSCFNVGTITTDTFFFFGHIARHAGS